MRKTIITILILLLGYFYLFAASVASEPYPFYLLGHVAEDVQFEIEFSNSVLPFDLTSNDVKYNATTQRDNTAYSKPLEVRGLYVGNFSLSSNTATFTIYISHTPLMLTGGNDSIDYRFYIQLGATYGHTVKSCLSSNEALDNPGGLPATENAGLIIIKGSDPYFSNVWGQGKSNQISIINTGVYVSLEDKGDDAVATAASTNEVIEALPAGNYSSNVYFLLVKDS